MKKLLIMMLVTAMSMAMFTGCVSDEDLDNASAVDGDDASNAVDEGIMLEAPVKMELGEDEMVVPEQITIEQLREKIEEIKVTGVEYEEEINKENIAALLVIIYGTGTSVLPEKLMFNPYLINQAEQIGYYIVMYQKDEENSKQYYDTLVNYLFFEQNEVFTFDCDDSRCQGSALSCLQIILSGKLYDGITEYNSELRTEGILVEQDAEFREYIQEIIAQ